MIPKVIHFCWYGGGEYNDVIKKCIASWKENLPDYTIVKWDESNTPFDQLPFLALLFKQKRWAFIADYVRLYAIYTQGGVYLDTDVEIVKSFDHLLNEPAFLGFQTDLGESKYPVNAAVIGCEKGNVFVEKCLRETERIQRLHYHAMAAPVVTTKILLEDYGVSEHKINKFDDVTLLPKAYFYPFSWLEKFAPECVKEETLAIHWWEDSWGKRTKNMNYYWRSFVRKLEKTPLLVQDNLKYVFKKKSFYYFEKL